ncbi:MAG: leucine-rich repeat protein [Kiritimatiellae bacterium]|nr:leucine-rich repeat protein [Kiritimatiellia bacterium]
MKVVKSILMGAALLASLPGVAADTYYTEMVNGVTWTYTINKGYASVGGGTTSTRAVLTSTSGAIAIPSKLGGYTVTGIGDYAFYLCANLTSVTIPDGVTSIGSSAFAGCSGLTSVTMPDSVTSMGDDAFSGCNNVRSVVVPGSTYGVPFDNVTNLVISVGTTNIGAYAFYYCTNLTSVTIPDSVTSIGFCAFSGCSGLTSVTIPNSVTNIGSSAFDMCTNLTSVTIGNGVKYIDWFAFDGCSGLTNVMFYGDAPTVGINVFSGVPSSCKAVILYGSSGWGTKIPRKWNGLNIDYLRCLVMFDANGGTGGGSENMACYAPFVAPTVTREGYTLTGWEPEVAAAVPTSNVTYTAQWEINQYTVTFDANGGTGGTCGNQDYGTVIVVPTVTREGYTFVGWVPEVAATVPASNVMYTAQWQCTVALNANGGTCGTADLNVGYGATIGVLPVPTLTKAVFLGWFTDAEGGDEVTADTVVTEGMTIYAHWLTEVANPVIATDGRTTFRTDSCEVTITCATEGVTIYFTDDGTTPKKNEDYLYTGPIAITDTTTFKAVAVIGDIQSGYVTVMIAKNLLTLEEALDGGGNVAVVTSEAAPWRPVFDGTAKVGDATARSGEIGNRTNTWLTATVEGAGTLSFWCKTSCEHDEDDTFTWDRLMVYTNGVEIAGWRMDGETPWTERTLSFDGGANTVKWVYFKDRTGTDGEDCVWVDGLTWTPSGAADPIPDVAAGASAAVVNAAVDDVGFADAAVKAAIGGSAAEYAAFKAWADSVKSAAGSAAAGEAAVVANTNAAAAYLLGAERLFENEPKIEFGEVALLRDEDVAQQDGMSVSVSVTVRDGETAVKCAAEKVAAMFEATSDLGDWDGAAKLTPAVTPEATGDAATMRFTVTPGDGTAPQAFLRIRK